MKQIMAPLPTSGVQLKAAYASITYSTGTAVITGMALIGSIPAVALRQPPPSRTPRPPRLTRNCTPPWKP